MDKHHAERTPRDRAALVIRAKLLVDEFLVERNIKPSDTDAVSKLVDDTVQAFENEVGLSNLDRQHLYDFLNKRFVEPAARREYHETSRTDWTENKAA